MIVKKHLIHERGAIQSKVVVVSAAAVLFKNSNTFNTGLPSIVSQHASVEPIEEMLEVLNTLDLVQPNSMTSDLPHHFHREGYGNGVWPCFNATEVCRCLFYSEVV